MDLVKIRSKLDATVTKASKGKVVSCKAGCSACCQQVVYATLAEAADIAARYPAKIAAVGPQLVEQSARLMRDANNERFWGNQCVFLEDGLCSIYEHRPLICRATLVVSPPEQCATPAGKVSKVDTRRDVQSALAEIMAGSKQPSSLLPLPMAMLIASTALPGSNSG